MPMLQPVSLSRGAKVLAVAAVAVMAACDVKCADSDEGWSKPDKGWPINPPVGALSAKIRIQGLDNTDAGYFLAVPDSYSPTNAWPLFLVLHGSGTDPSGMISVFRAGLMQKGVIAVFPTALRNQLLEWNYPHSGSYLLAIIRDVAATYRIDPRRIYLAGHSMGGGGTWAMGAIMPQLWAALGPISGWALPNPRPPLENMKGMPIYCIHGKLDKSVPAALSERTFADLKRLGNTVRQYDVLPDPKALLSSGEINIFREIQEADHAVFLPWKERGAPETGLMVAWMLTQRRAAPADLAAAEKALADWAAPFGWKPDGKLGQYADGKMPGGDAETAGARDLQGLARQFRVQAGNKQYAEAEETCRRMVAAAPALSTSHYNLGCMLARQGKKAEALEALAKAVSLGFSAGALMNTDEDLESLRDDDEFKALLKKADATAGPTWRDTGPMVIGNTNAWLKGVGTEPPKQDKPAVALALPNAARDRMLTDVCFVDGLNGWLVGDKALCAATTDGGQTWKVVTEQSDAVFRGIAFGADGLGWICGDGDTNAPRRMLYHSVFSRPPRAGSLLGSAAGGATWRTNWVPSNFEMQCVGWNGSVGVVGTSGGRGHLDGDIFVFSLPRTISMKNVYRTIFSVTPCGDKRWIAVGAPVSVRFTPSPKESLFTRGGCRALFSTNNAVSWQPAEGSEAKAGGCLRGTAAKPNGRALAVGDKGEILLSLDAGQTWKAVPSGATEALLDVAWGENQRAVAVGRKGLALVSTDDGATWSRFDAGTAEDLRAVSAAGRRFVVVGGTGLCLSLEL